MDDLKQMVRQIAANKSYHRLSNGKIVNLRQKEIKELTDAVVQLDVPLKDLKKEMSLPLYKAFGVDTDAGIVHQDEDFMTLINRMEKPEKIDFDLPEDLNATLRPYQETGYKWLKGLDHYGFGGILADDMGLGKTLQVISFIAGSLGEGDAKPYLVICPSSVLYNWQKEFKQFAPGIRTQLITGTKSERSDCVTTAIAGNIPVWITSYPLLQRDEDLYEGLAFRTVILDEAQSVKNATAKTTKAASALQRQQQNRVERDANRKCVVRIVHHFQHRAARTFRNESGFQENGTSADRQKSQTVHLAQVEGGCAEGSAAENRIDLLHRNDRKTEDRLLVAAAVDAPGNKRDAGCGYAERKPDQNLGRPDAPAPNLLRSGLGHGRLQQAVPENWTG